MTTRELIGLFFAVLGGLALLVWVMYASFYRYDHPKLTETELHIWYLKHWYAWLVPMAVAFGGYSLTISKRK